MKKMKKFIALFLVFVLAFAVPAFAGVKILEDDAVEGNVSEVNVSTGLDAAVSGSKVTLTVNGSQAITGGTINGATIGASSPSTGAFTTLTANSGKTVHFSPAITALTAGASVTLTVGSGNQLFTDTITTDNQDQTITFSGPGSVGDRITIIFVTDSAGSADEVITFHGTLVRSVGTLTLANAAASRYVVSFISDGSKWNEISRTAIQAA